MTIEKPKCFCGCGKELPKQENGGRKRKYFSRDCYPSEKRKWKRDEVLPWLKVCRCPCHQIFTDSALVQRRLYHTPVKCRNRYLDATQVDPKWGRHYKTGPIEQPVSMAEKRVVRSFQQVVCCGMGVKGGGKFQGPCDHFPVCSAKEIAGGKFNHEENGFLDCYNNLLPVLNPTNNQSRSNLSGRSIAKRKRIVSKMMDGNHSFDSIADELNRGNFRPIGFPKRRYNGKFVMEEVARGFSELN